jgi:hypothetical protein
LQGLVVWINSVVTSFDLVFKGGEEAIDVNVAIAAQLEGDGVTVDGNIEVGKISGHEVGEQFSHLFTGVGGVDVLVESDSDDDAVQGWWVNASTSAASNLWKGAVWSGGVHAVSTGVWSSASAKWGNVGGGVKDAVRVGWAIRVASAQWLAATSSVDTSESAWIADASVVAGADLVWISASATSSWSFATDEISSVVKNSVQSGVAVASVVGTERVWNVGALGAGAGVG